MGFRFASWVAGWWGWGAGRAPVGIGLARTGWTFRRVRLRPRPARGKLPIWLGRAACRWQVGEGADCGRARAAGCFGGFSLFSRVRPGRGKLVIWLVRTARAPCRWAGARAAGYSGWLAGVRAEWGVLLIWIGRAPCRGARGSRTGVRPRRGLCGGDTGCAAAACNSHRPCCGGLRRAGHDVPCGVLGFWYEWLASQSGLFQRPGVRVRLSDR